ncbi:MAG TPA: thioredoxin [Candidatus Flavonifractor merdipullorum]|uniref:Thioredoxin n=1 Tax=Candidatus Flavonifractor merdipullorum TaxID=2838590 RepID=A0A9D1UPA9_9FIRM|nr:thioredoxin [Candidatus Flavonifractor merdipullorum]
MAVQHFNQASFNDAISNNKVVLVDFWATWCGPCRMLAPVIEQLGAQYEGKVVVGKVDTDEQPALAMQFGIMSIPTVILFKDGKEVERKVGVMPAQAYTQMLDAAL